MITKLLILFDKATHWSTQSMRNMIVFDLVCASPFIVLFAIGFLIVIKNIDKFTQI